MIKDNIYGILEYKLYRFLLKNHIIPSQVILLMDGGICSQMHQYLLGQLYAQKGNRIRYDLSFYESWGSDLEQNFVRNFDLLKAFPYLPFRRASATAIRVYKKKYFVPGNNSGVRLNNFDFLQQVPPIYLGGYYHLPPRIWLETFQQLFKLRLDVLDVTNRKMYDEIQRRRNSVAVHVRRGDLKVERFDYGKPASEDYFKDAILYLKQKTVDPYFYFFSDEPVWISETLIPQLNLVDQYKIVDINGSDKGYMDLFLIASCKHQVTSKGTLGKYGAIMQDSPDKIVILCNDDIEYSWRPLLYNPVFL